MKKFFILLLFLLVVFSVSAWDEFNQYSIADELKKPGVKLVAVDFYATWCEPCNAAIPTWKKLQEKYGDKGFKLIVVSVQSEGSCSQPLHWTPDKIVCDYDGDIADAWHANDLPQAFLWSWQGNLLVAHGGVDNVAAAIETYFKKIPRVYVEEGFDENIYKIVRSELIKNSKIEVVASDEERKALAELRKKSTNLNYDTKLQCKLGEEISANSRLVISKQKRGKKDALVLELFSVEKGCLTASGSASIRGNPEQEVAEAVYNLLKNLLGSVSMPGEGGQQIKTQKPIVQNSNFQDALACEQARKESSDFVWKAYLKSYPTGECATEAKAELDKTACYAAEKHNSIDGWKEYLNEFPDGICATEAKKEFDRTACKIAEEKNYVNGWEEYLKEYPNGECANAANNFIENYREKDKEACQKARQIKNEKELGKHLRNYLQQYPEGQCAAEVRVILDVITCNQAKKEDTLEGWENYLNEYPNGKCSEEAKQQFNKHIELSLKKGRDMKIAGATLLTVGAVGFTLGFLLGALCEDGNGTSFLLGSSIGGALGGSFMIIGLPLMVAGVKKEKKTKSYLEMNNLAVLPQKDGFYATVGFNF